MNKFIVYALPLAFVISGCAVRTIPYEVDRVDQEIKGNRGMLLGSAPDVPKKEGKKTKKMYKIEIELFSPMDAEKIKKEDKKEIKDIYGNKGYVGTKTVVKERPGRELKTFPASKIAPVVYEKPPEAKNKQKKIAAQKEKKQSIYTVKKGDTLQGISNKLYGTTRKWQKIYEANKDVLKSPDAIMPGQRIVIPEE